MDDNYQTYLNRVARQTLPETYLSQLQHIQESPKFERLSNGSFQAAPFPGYTVITPPWDEDDENTDFYTKLKDTQQQLLHETGAGLIVPVSPESFHLTLADLIWDSAYRDTKQENPNFEEQLQRCIGDCFRPYADKFQANYPLIWEIVGLMVMPRAIGVCLTPKDENSYERTVQLRRSIYQNRDLIALGLEQQYHFTAHVTLGYFGEISPQLDCERLSNILLELNKRSLSKPVPTLCIKQAQLRKFDNMIHYYRQPDWPFLEF